MTPTKSPSPLRRGEISETKQRPAPCGGTCAALRRRCQGVSVLPCIRRRRGLFLSAGRSVPLPSAVCPSKEAYL